MIALYQKCLETKAAILGGRKFAFWFEIGAEYWGAQIYWLMKSLLVDEKNMFTIISTGLYINNSTILQMERILPK